MKYICKNKCYFMDRIWEPGETLALPEGKEANKHFKPYDPKKATEQEDKSVEAGTLLDLQREEARAALASVGHGVKKAPEFNKGNIQKGEADFLM